MATTTKISTEKYQLQQYSNQDTNLISPFVSPDTFSEQDSIEFFIYDNNNRLIQSIPNYTNYSIDPDTGTNAGPNIENNSISNFNISPSNDVESFEFSQGQYVAYYNFIKNHIGDFDNKLYISEISSDRTEIRLNSSTLSSIDRTIQTNNFRVFRVDQNYFVDFYLNFGNNQLVIANNIKLDESNINDVSILIKLYEPLPPQFDLKDELWVVTMLSNPEAFQITFPPEIIPAYDSSPLSGPNFNIPIKGQVNNSSQNLSYSDIISNAPSSSQDQINSLLEESSIPISVDYKDFNDFIYFSSAQTRIENFRYKVNLIEQHSASISTLSNVTGSGTSKVLIQSKISDIIKNFDQFEYFMYYDSGSSKSWPKTTTEPPYLLAKTTSPTALTWFGSADEDSPYYGGMIRSSSNFDNSNINSLYYAIPEYLRDDPQNREYELFVDMVAQYYDNIWLYTKDITEKYNADNRLDFGVSKELVADAIKDFGVKLYQNNFSNKDLYTGFLGITSTDSTFPFPEITQSKPVSTGMEFVDTLVSASNDVISMDDTNKSLYKRLYHNIPYLLNTKGTITGLRALITSYGIPDTILRISEFGGKDKVNANDWDLYNNNFNYALGVGPDLNFITSSWEVNSAWGANNNRPSTVQFRFKPEEISSNISPFGLTNLTQSLWSLADGTDTSQLFLEYSGSGLDSGSLVNTSGSYSGSIKDPYYQYANLKFIPYFDEPHISASLYLPFFDGGWWSVMVQRQSSTKFKLCAGNKIYNGKDGTSIGYYSSSINPENGDSTVWDDATTSIFTSQSLNFPTYKGFSGSLQEIRYYTEEISESVFKDYVMNPLSFEGNGVNSAPNQLIFRADLGSELDTSFETTDSRISIHPKVTGSFESLIPSFTSNSNYHLFNARAYPIGTYNTNVETFFLDQPAVGIKNRITDKIRFEDSTIPTGDVLSPFRRLSQTIEASASYSENINYLEVAFSPQNQINDDIIGQIGHFNIGDYIGDPRQRFSGSRYEDLNTLSEDYFKKYLKQYDLVDFVRLIKFFDNSLFKMIKDFIPVRTSLASGLVVKQHLLERNKYAQPSVQREELLLTGSIDIGSIEGGPGGMLNKFNFPPAEVILTITNTFTSSGSNVKIFIYSDERGLLKSFDLTTTTPIETFLELYPGENIYLEGQNETTSNFNKSFRIDILTKETSPIFSMSSPVITFIGVLSGNDPENILQNGTVQTTNEFALFDPSTGYYKANVEPKTTVQQWTETFSTLSGSVSKVQESQDEYYNGEFSGSVMFITNGELNPGCDPFKKLNVSDSNYAIRNYWWKYYDGGTNPTGEYDWLLAANDPLQGFISVYSGTDTDTNPESPSGGWPEGFPAFIKIAKQDQTGADKSNQLDLLTDLTIISGSNPSNFPKIGLEPFAEYGNHFVYKCISGNGIRPTNPVYTITGGSNPWEEMSKPSWNFENQPSNIGPDYRGDAINFLFNQTTVVDTSTVPNILNNNDTPLYDWDGGETAAIVLPTTFQQDLIFEFTASITASNQSGDPNFGVGYLSRTPDGTEASGFVPFITEFSYYTESFSGKIVLSASQAPAGTEYGFLIEPVPFDTGITASVNDFSLKIRSVESYDDVPAWSDAGYTGSLPTRVYYNNVLEPLVDGNFTTALDCQPTLNNVQAERPNPFLQDVDYSTSTTVAVNYQAIVSESAVKATVPESHYTQLSSTNPRYNGAKITTQAFNNPLKVGKSLTSLKGESPFIQYSISTSVLVFRYVATYGGGGKYHQKFTIRGLLTPQGEYLNFTNNKNIINRFEQAFTSTADTSYQNIYGDPNNPAKWRALSFFTGSSIDGFYTGESQLTYDPATTDGAQLIVYHSGALADTLPSNTSNKGPGGVLFSAGIDFTSAKDFPNTAEEILVDKGIIKVT